MAFTAEELVRTWQARAGSVHLSTRRLVEFAGQRMLARARTNMQNQIYDLPVDRTASGKSKWVRTRQLYLHERLESAAAGSAVTLTNDMSYARARHELGRDGRKTKRPAHWRDGIIPAIRPIVLAEAERLRVITGGKR